MIRKGNNGYLNTDINESSSKKKSNERDFLPSLDSLDNSRVETSFNANISRILPNKPIVNTSIGIEKKKSEAKLWEDKRAKVMHYLLKRKIMNKMMSKEKLN